MKWGETERQEIRERVIGANCSLFFLLPPLSQSLSLFQCLAPWFSVREPVRDKTKRTVSLLGTILLLSHSHSVSHSPSSRSIPVSLSLFLCLSFFGLIPFFLSAAVHFV